MKITRSSKLHLKFANRNKIESLFRYFQEDVDDLVQSMFDQYLYSETVPKFSGKDTYSSLPYPARTSQLIMKEIFSVIRSIHAKLKQIPVEPGANLQKYQKELLDKFNAGVLKIQGIGQLNLDNRFVEIVRDDGSTSFDYWISFKFPGQTRKVIPFNETRHIRNLLDRGFSLKPDTLRIKRNGEVELTFHKEVSEKHSGQKIGIDIGRNKAFVTSDGLMETLSKDILSRLKSKKHGSKNKARSIRRMKQEIDREIRKIPFHELRVIYLERLTGMKPGKKWGNTNHHWSYTYIQNRIGLHAQEHGVRIQHVSPSYTSQTCSSCGHTSKSSRKGEDFSCVRCGMEIDADLNASINILHRGTNSAHCHKRKRSHKIRDC